MASPVRCAVTSDSDRIGEVRLALRRAKGAEIVLAHKTLRRRVHRCRIKADGHPPDPARIQGGSGASIENAVFIVSLKTGEARMKVGRNLIRIEDYDGVGAQVKIQGIAYFVRRQRFGDVHMGDHAERHGHPHLSALPRAPYPRPRRTAQGRPLRLLEPMAH